MVKPEIMKKLLFVIPMFTLLLTSCSTCYECTSEDSFGVALVRETCDEDEMQEYENDGWDCDLKL